MSEIIVLQIVGVIIAIITLTFVVINPIILVPWRYNRLKTKEKHLKRLQREVLEPLCDLEITQENFNVKINGLDELIVLSSYNWTIQHMKDRYLYILTNFDASINLIEGLNTKLTKFKKVVLEIIKSEIGAEKINFYSARVWLIIDRILNGELESLDDVDIETRGDNIDIIISSDRKQSITITSKYYDDKNKTKEFFFNLPNNKKFKDNLEKIKNDYDEAKNLWGAFQEDLKKLINNINNEDELKGKCVKCSFRIRRLGDC